MRGCGGGREGSSGGVGMWLDSGSGVKVEGTDFVGKLDTGWEGRKGSKVILNSWT